MSGLMFLYIYFPKATFVDETESKQDGDQWRDGSQAAGESLSQTVKPLIDTQSTNVVFVLQFLFSRPC